MTESWDYFFYRGQLPLPDENEFDMRQGLKQPLRSLSYFRSEGAGVQEAEGNPNALTLNILLRYNISKWVAYRNQYVTNGNLNTIDRRIAVSQNNISFSLRGGELDISVFYIPFADFTKPQTTTLTGV
jgi:hypothetical protein